MLTSVGFYLVIAAVIIIALGFYAGKLLCQLKAQRLKADEAAKKVQAGINEHDTKILKSVVLIVKAMQAEQCDYSEGCWRLSVLLDSLKTVHELEQQFPAIFELYNEIKHMPILEARKQMPKKDRMKLDLQRMKLEADLLPGIKTDLNLLLPYAEEKLVALKP